MRIDRKPCPFCEARHTTLEAFDLELEDKLNTEGIVYRCPTTGERIYYRGRAPHWQWRKR